MKKTDHRVHHWSWLLLFAFFIAGLLSPILGLAALACMLAPVAVAFYRGRQWCGTFCPRGSFNDVLLSKISRRFPLPALFKVTWFRLSFMVALMTFFLFQLIAAWGNLAGIGLVFLRMVFATTLLAVILGTFYNHRTWCMICPMGTIAHYVSRHQSASKNQPKLPG